MSNFLPVDAIVLEVEDSDDSAGADDRRVSGSYLGNKSKSVAISHSWKKGVRFVTTLKYWWNPEFCNSVACGSPTNSFRRFCVLSKKSAGVDGSLEKAAKAFRGLEGTLYTVLSEVRANKITIWNDSLDALVFDIICTCTCCFRVAPYVE